MPRQFTSLPQLDGGLFLTDAGLETDMVFNHGHDLPAFAAHTLLEGHDGRTALETYFRGYLDLAARLGAGFVLDAPTWRAQRFFARELETGVDDLRLVNYDAVQFVSALREEYAERAGPIVLNGLVGPRGDAYAPEDRLSIDAYESYHAEQIGWLEDAGVDMVSALTFTNVEEAIGAARAARKAGLPIMISFTVETDGRLPTGMRLEDAVKTVDVETDHTPAYYMLNCAHPDHFRDVLSAEPWLQRIRGFRCNASRKSHAELDECDTLDAGDPRELAGDYVDLVRRLPWANVFGGCCGTDLRHVAEIADTISQKALV